MKIIALGDTHGRRFWKTVVNHYFEQCDKIVFIGDYFDSFDIGIEQQINNFLDIVEFKRANPDKVVLLIGNHDFHYLPLPRQMGESYSGFQGKNAAIIGHALEGAKDVLQMAYQHGEWLFTHAGVTTTWMKRLLSKVQGVPSKHVEDRIPQDKIAEVINDGFIFSPMLFTFVGSNPYGDSVESSPIWVRPDSLMRNAYRYEIIKQVVGHTSQNTIRMQKNRFFFIDAVAVNQFLIIDHGVAEPVQITYQDYEERQREELKPWQKHKHDDDEMVP